MQFDFVSTFSSAEEEQTTPEEYSTAASENPVLPWKLANYKDGPDGVSNIKVEGKNTRLVCGCTSDETIDLGLDSRYLQIQLSIQNLCVKIFFS